MWADDALFLAVAELLVGSFISFRPRQQCCHNTNIRVIILRYSFAVVLDNVLRVCHIFLLLFPEMIP